MNKSAQEIGASIRKMRVLKPDNPLDQTIDDIYTVSGDRINKELEKRKVLPNTLADQVKKALG